MKATAAEDNSLLSELRRATAPAHRRLDHGLGYLTSPALTRPRYQRLLEGFHGFYSPLERRLSSVADRFTAANTSWGLRLWTPLLEREAWLCGRGCLE